MKKILAFIKNKDNKLLLLKGSKDDPQFHESFWYTVTGAKENEDSSLIDTVIREVKEETNLDVKNICYLNWIFTYRSLGVECEEYIFICEGNQKMKIILNEENIDYKWVGIEEFVNTIKWYDNKETLKEVLKLALNNVQYFKEEKTTKV